MSLYLVIPKLYFKPSPPPPPCPVLSQALSVIDMKRKEGNTEKRGRERRKEGREIKKKQRKRGGRVE